MVITDMNSTIKGNLILGWFKYCGITTVTFVSIILFTAACRTEVTAPYTSGTFAPETKLGIEDTFQKKGYKPLEQKQLKKLLQSIQKDSRKAAELVLDKQERNFEWNFWIYPDTVSSFISYVPPAYAVFSAGLLRSLDTLQVDEYSAAIYHFFGHYESGHFRKRSEFFLMAEFGGSSLKVAVKYDVDRLIEGMLTLNGAIGRGRNIQPFKIEEEAEAERIAGEAFLMGRKDSVTIFDAWRRITPESKWGNDILRIHTGKSKMTNF